MAPDMNADIYVDICKTLNSDWDPIGLAPLDDEDTEYLTYSPRIYSMLKDDADAQAIQSYLDSTVRDRMGLTPDTQKSALVAATLAAFKSRLV